MNVTEFLQELRDILHDDDKRIWTDAEIVRHGDRQLRGLVRLQAGMDPGYHNLEYNVAGSALAQIYEGVWEAPLPNWVMSVSGCWRRTNLAPSQSTSPQAVDEDNVQIERITGMVPRGDMHARSGFYMTSSNTLRLLNYTSPQDLVVRVAKRPAAMFKATLDVAGFSTTQFYLPSTYTIGAVESEVGAYRNAIVQFTGVDSEGHAIGGQIRGCVESIFNEYVAAARKSFLRLDRALPVTPTIGDTVESILEIPDQHVRLLVLRVAQCCFQKRHQVDALKTILPELGEQERMFRTYVRPRNRQELGTIHKAGIGLRRAREGERLAQDFY